jgi:hypothetical protein
VAVMGEHDVWIALGLMALVMIGLLATRKPIPMFSPSRQRKTTG